MSSFSHSLWGVFGATLCDNICLWFTAGLWFSPGHLVTSTNKTEHDRTKILLNVALNTTHIILQLCIFFSAKRSNNLQCYWVIDLIKLFRYLILHRANGKKRKNGNIICTDVIEDTMKTIRITSISVSFFLVKYCSYFLLFFALATKQVRQIWHRLSFYYLFL